MEARGFNVGNLALGNSGNLFWGMQFRTCKNFWDFADSKSSLNPKNSYKYKSHTAITSIVIRCTNLKISVIARRIADSRKAIHTPRFVIARKSVGFSWQSKKINQRIAQPYKSFCFVL